MQKVIIRNLGPVKECEIILKPFTVFIGESGTGKSAILKTISLLKWIYKKMQYKELLKQSKITSDALRFRLKSLLENSMLDDFVTKDTYIEFLVNEVSLIVIENNRLTPRYENIQTNSFSAGKIVFINDTRVAIPELLSSPGGKRISMSYLTDDMIKNFHEAIKSKKELKLSTMDISLFVRVKNWYDYFFIRRGSKEIKFENSSSGEKSSAVIEAVSDYFSKEYDFDDGFSKVLLDLVSQKVEIEQVDRLQKFIKKSDFKSFLDIFIEEPEANLFPTNQHKLAHYLSSIMKNKNKPNIIIATHSPYILTALNGLILAHYLYQNPKVDKEKIDSIISVSDHLDMNDLAAYEVGNGTVKSIFNKEFDIVDAQSIDEVTIVSAEQYQELCKIEAGLKNAKQ